MRRVIMAMLALVTLLGASAGKADWIMRVHQGETVTEFLVSSVDSVTFYDFKDSFLVNMVPVPAGSFTMGDGSAVCGVDERVVTRTHVLYLGQHEITNLEYMNAVQWAYDNGYVSATATTVQDNLDGSTEELLNLDEDDCEIQFDGAGTFFLRESPSSEAQSTYPGGYEPSDHPVKM